MKHVVLNNKYGTLGYILLLIASHNTGKFVDAKLSKISTLHGYTVNAKQELVRLHSNIIKYSEISMFS